MTGTTSEPTPEAALQLVHKLSSKDKAKFSSQVQEELPGLFNLDPKTRRLIWAAVFAVLLVVAVGALAIIWHSYTVDINTTTTIKGTTTTSVTHPDVSAAWAVVSAVIAGIVGLLVPSPAGAKP